MKDDSLAAGDAILSGEMLMIWGRQDPHIPLEGRMAILQRSSMRLGTQLQHGMR